MADLWSGLSPITQDILVFLAILTPLVILAIYLIRGFAPWALVAAILWRFRWINLIFVLLIAITVGMGISLPIQERGLQNATSNAADKFDLIIAAPGSEISTLLSTVFLQPNSAKLLDGAIYNQVTSSEHVKIAAPITYSDRYGAAKVIGTTAEFASHLSSGNIVGRLWQSKFEAVAGASVDLLIGDSFTPTHGMALGTTNSEKVTNNGNGQNGAGFINGERHEKAFEVVGKMAPTGTPWDYAIMVPVEAVWEVHGSLDGHWDRDVLGPPFDEEVFPGTTAIIVVAEAPAGNDAIRAQFAHNNQTMVFSPKDVLANLYVVMGDIRQAMSLLSSLSQILVAASVLLGLFLLSRLFQRHMALLQALGAPARFMVCVMWTYGAVLLVFGCLLGVGFGLLASDFISGIVSDRTNMQISSSIAWADMHLVAGFLTITSFLVLVPAYLNMRQPLIKTLRV